MLLHACVCIGVGMYVCVPHTCVGACRGWRRTLNPLELEFQAVVLRDQMGSGPQDQVLSTKMYLPQRDRNKRQSRRWGREKRKGEEEETERDTDRKSMLKWIYLIS